MIMEVYSSRPAYFGYVMYNELDKEVLGHWGIPVERLYRTQEQWKRGECPAPDTFTPGNMTTHAPFLGGVVRLTPGKRFNQSLGVHYNGMYCLGVDNFGPEPIDLIRHVPYKGESAFTSCYYNINWHTN